MAAFDFDAVLKALAATEELDEGQLALIEVAGETVVSWDAGDYASNFEVSRLEALGIQRLVRDAFGAMGVTDTRAIEMPDGPPYLKNTGRIATYGKPDGAGTLQIKQEREVGDYDPTDPTQFAKIGDQYFRWDGKRNEQYPKGRPHEITFIDHRLVNGIQVPDRDQVTEARLKQLGWFHKGYGCWVLPNGKRSVEVPQEQLIAMRNVSGPRARVLA